MSKLLFIQYRRFSAVPNGGDLCTKRNYDALCQVLGKENVEVYIIHEEENHSSLFAYIKGALYIPFGYFFGLTPARVRQIAEKAKDYDNVFIDRSVFGILAKELKQSGYKGKVITHFHNVEAQYFDAKLPKRLPFRRVLLRCAAKNDEQACRFSDERIALNRRDAAELQQSFGTEIQTVIPITLPDKASVTPSLEQKTSQRLKCLFLGSYFAANNEGVIWFMRNVAPSVNVEVKIVGKGMGKLKEQYPELLQNAEVVSDAPDLVPYFQWADVMVLPIFSGSGMKVKTCESLMYGKNILGTDEAFEGYAIEEGVSGWRCNKAEDFINCIRDFEVHPRPHYNTAARQLYLDNYSDESVVARFKKTL